MGKIYFLSRPRRFGKSLLVSTLKYYFEGKKELFKGLAIDDLEKEWKQYPVFHLDFNGKNFTKPGELQRTLNGFIEKQEAIYGKDPYHDTLGDRFIYVLAQAHRKTGLRAVILIDEYDKALLDVLDTGLKTKDEYGNEMLLEEENREILKGILQRIQGGRPRLAVCIAHRSYQVFAGQRIQRFQSAGRHQSFSPLRYALRHNRGGIALCPSPADKRDG